MAPKDLNANQDGELIQLAQATTDTSEEQNTEQTTDNAEQVENPQQPLDVNSPAFKQRMQALLASGGDAGAVMAELESMVIEAAIAGGMSEQEAQQMAGSFVQTVEQAIATGTPLDAAIEQSVQASFTVPDTTLANEPTAQQSSTTNKQQTQPVEQPTNVNPNNQGNTETSQAATPNLNNNPIGQGTTSNGFAPVNDGSGPVFGPELPGNTGTSSILDQINTSAPFSPTGFSAPTSLNNTITPTVTTTEERSDREEESTTSSASSQDSNSQTEYKIYSIYDGSPQGSIYVWPDLRVNDDGALVSLDQYLKTHGLYTAEAPEVRGNWLEHSNIISSRWSDGMFQHSETFNPTIANDAAILSALAYESEDVIAKWLSDHTNLELVTDGFYSDSQDNQFFVARNSDNSHYTLSFRGTEGLADVLTDIDAGFIWDGFNEGAVEYDHDKWKSKALLPLRGDVHDGFAQLALAALNNIPDEVATDLITGRADITVTGHSLGGGAAEIFIAMLKELNVQAQAYTIGAPASGNQNFIDSYKDLPVFGMNEVSDPVAHITETEFLSLGSLKHLGDRYLFSTWGDDHYLEQEGYDVLDFERINELVNEQLTLENIGSNPYQKNDDNNLIFYGISDNEVSVETTKLYERVKTTGLVSTTSKFTDYLHNNIDLTGLYTSIGYDSFNFPEVLNFATHAKYESYVPFAHAFYQMLTSTPVTASVSYQSQVSINEGDTVTFGLGLNHTFYKDVTVTYQISEYVAGVETVLETGTKTINAFEEGIAVSYNTNDDQIFTGTKNLEVKITNVTNAITNVGTINYIVKEAGDVPPLHFEEGYRIRFIDGEPQYNIQHEIVNEYVSASTAFIGNKNVALNMVSTSQTMNAILDFDAGETLSFYENWTDAIDGINYWQTIFDGVITAFGAVKNAAYGNVAGLVSTAIQTIVTESVDKSADHIAKSVGAFYMDFGYKVLSEYTAKKTEVVQQYYNGTPFSSDEYYSGGNYQKISEVYYLQKLAQEALTFGMNIYSSNTDTSTDYSWGNVKDVIGKLLVSAGPSNTLTTILDHTNTMTGIIDQFVKTLEFDYPGTKQVWEDISNPENLHSFYSEKTQETTYQKLVENGFSFEVDNSPVISMEETAITVQEGTKTVQVTLTRTGDLTKESFVQLNLTRNTAETDDYTVDPSSLSVRFAADSDTETVTIYVNSDADTNDDTFTLTLDSQLLSNAKISDTQNSTQITITDNNSSGNNPPETTSDQASIKEGDPAIAIRVTDNDSDNDDDLITVTEFTQGTYGTVKFAEAETRVITDGNAQSRVLSGNGEFVVYSAWYDQNSDTIDGHIYRENLITGELRLVDTDSSGNLSTGDSQQPLAISDDGRYVLFTLDEYGAVTMDPNAPPRDPNDFNAVSPTGPLYRKDLDTGAVVRVDTLSDWSTVTPSWGVGSVAMSADGQTVVFGHINTEYAGLEKVSGGFGHVYHKNLVTGELKVVDTDSNGNISSGRASDGGYGLGLSSDGNIVTFLSTDAGDLVGNISLSQYASVFAKNMTTGAVTLVNADANGTPSDNNSYGSAATLSGDGKYVAFTSAASNLVSGVSGGPQLYVKNIQTGEIIVASQDENGVLGNAYSGADASFSEDGRFVVFESWASNLVSNDTNNLYDVFVKDLQTGEIARVSEGHLGEEVDEHARGPQISADGKVITFHSRTSTIDPNGNNGSDMFVTYNPLSPDAIHQTLTYVVDETNNLSEGQVVTDTFTYTVSDGNGGYKTELVSVEVTGKTPPPVISMLDDVIEINEADGTAIVRLQRAGDLSHSSIVNFSINSGTAEAGDYTLPNPASVTFAEGVEFANIEIPIHADTEKYNDYFTVNLSSNGNTFAAIDSQASQTKVRLWEAEGWTVYAHDVNATHEAPENHDDVFKNGKAQIGTHLANQSYYFSNFVHIGDLGVDGNDFEVTLRAKNPYNVGVSAYDIRLYAHDADMAGFGGTFMGTSASHFASFSISNGLIGGGITERGISTMNNLQYNSWVNLSIKSDGNTVATYKNGVKLYETANPYDIGDISRLYFNFKGAGSADWIEVKDGAGNRVFFDDFGGAPTSDPLIFDFNRDGQFISTQPIQFDTDSDGYHDNSTWMSDADGMLVLDENNNGIIDNMSEVFSEHMNVDAESSLAALATFDNNADDVIDENDTIWTDLKVWRDANSDGITDNGELYTMADLDIASINLNSMVTDENVDGGTVFSKGSFTYEDGSQGEFAEVAFEVFEEVQNVA